MRFTKMHGLGNDYVYVNCFDQRVPDPPGLSRAISDRHRGVGSDGLILIRPSDTADARMEMYNADGSRGRMCGNGIRCVAKYVYERGLSRRNPLRIETDAGTLELDLTLDGEDVTAVRVDMGRPSLLAEDLPANVGSERLLDTPLDIGGRTYRVTGVSMGNPHAVVFVDDPEGIDLANIGPQFEHAPIFPQRINVHFARVDSSDRLRMRTWERGSGITQACGTGACAVAVAAAATGRTARTVTVTLPGGDLLIEWAENDHVYKTGPATEVFSGDWPD